MRPPRSWRPSGWYHPDTEGKHQAENHRATTPAASCTRSHSFNSDGPDPLLNRLLTCPKGSDDIHLCEITNRSRRETPDALLRNTCCTNKTASRTRFVLYALHKLIWEENEYVRHNLAQWHDNCLFRVLLGGTMKDKQAHTHDP